MAQQLRALVALAEELCLIHSDQTEVLTTICNLRGLVPSFKLQRHACVAQTYMQAKPLYTQNYKITKIEKDINKKEKNQLKEERDRGRGERKRETEGGRTVHACVCVCVCVCVCECMHACTHN